MYVYTCLNEECGHINEEVRPYDSRNEPMICTECGSLAEYRVSAPMVLQASFPDGYRRQHDPLWRQARETSKLKLANARAKHTGDDRERIQDEIAKVNKTERKKRKRAVDLLD